MKESKNKYINAALNLEAHEGDRVIDANVDSSKFEISDWSDDINRNVISKHDEKLFDLILWDNILSAPPIEWLIKKLLPTQGLATIYGLPNTYKSILSCHIAMCVATGCQWGERKVRKGTVIYIAAESPAGIKKRMTGLSVVVNNFPSKLPFALLERAPNFGTSNDDRNKLISTIQQTFESPNLIIIDTLSQTLGGGDENGSGMITLVNNANYLAHYFKCLVLIVHHSGLSNDKRLRGHSSLHGAVDVSILCEKSKEPLKALLTIQKQKDEATNTVFDISLTKVIIGHDVDGDEISTLVVQDIIESDEKHTTPRPKRIPESERLVTEVLLHAIEEEGVSFRPFGLEGPEVIGVPDRVARTRYYNRLAEKAAPDEDSKKLGERQRKSFNRTIKKMADSKRLEQATI